VRKDGAMPLEAQAWLADVMTSVLAGVETR